MCHDSAIEILGTFIKIENAVKSKKPANLTICRLYHVFLRVFEKIEKLSFRLLLPFWWGVSKSFEPELARPWFCRISSLQDTNVPRFCHKT
jgi:hypothetical protein